jgi:hypothetical protein
VFRLNEIAAAAPRKLILLELNEVPFRVIDAYCALRPDSTLATILPRCAQYLTDTQDQLALDPWVSWPTLHRGVTDASHAVLHLGQADEASDRAFPPIWRLLKAHGLSVGVFGSLHSSSIPADATQYSFYLPDYFAATDFAHPRELVSFQSLNLAMTRESARNVRRSFPPATLAAFLRHLPSSGVSWATLTDSVAQLWRELFNKSLRIRRRAYQPLLMADLFLHQLARSRPDFATFYTNHVAAAMHRYWGAMFPQDYAQPLDAEWVRRYAGEIVFAMDKFDVILRRLVEFTRRDPRYVVLIASSMGQAAIPAERTDEFLTITDPAVFMQALGVPSGEWSPRPAMVPVVSFVVSERYRERFSAALASLRLGDVASARSKRPVCPICFDESETGFFQVYCQLDSFRGDVPLFINGEPRSAASAGLGMMPHEDGVNCTAQHVREGSLLVFDQRAEPQVQRPRQQISTLDVVPSICRFFGIESPGYMHGRACLEF